MDITGKIIDILPEVTGQSKNGTWKKQDFVIETQDEYPKKVCISTWGDKININSFQPNDNIKVYFNLESKEYNSRWYTTARAWKIEKETQQDSNNNQSAVPPPSDVPPANENDEFDDLPF